MSEFDFDRAAQALYGGTTPTAATAPVQGTAQRATDEQVLAERLFGNTNKPTAPARTAPRDDRPFTELNEAEQADRLYGSTDPTVVHRDAVQAIINAGLEDHLHTPEVAGDIASQWAEVFSQHNLNSIESLQLAELGASVMANPPTAEVMSHWTETAISNLQSDYGPHGAGQALQDARAYISQIPNATDLLNFLGLGSHPRIVALAAARGRALRLAGRLK